jgi:hypothetical protein
MSRIQKVKAGLLDVDPDVQRGFNKRKAEKIRNAWDDAVVGVLVVSKRADGTYWIIEGQHRWWAGRDLFGDNYTFTCEVHVGLSLEDEAKMFIQINTLRSLPSPFDRFRVSLKAGYEEEVAIDRTVQKLGLSLGPSARTETIGAIEALRRVLREVDEQGLFDVIDVVIEAFGRAAETYDADLLQAIAALFKAKPDLDRKRLAKVLTKSARTQMSPSDWKRAGAQMKKYGGSASRRLPIARLIGEAYDNGISESKKIKL